MTLNGNGVRDIAGVLHISPTTVIQELKKLALLNQVNQKLLQRLKSESVEVDIVRVEESQEAGVEESELDEMWSYVGKKSNPRWLWQAIDRRSGKVLAYVFGRRKDEVFVELKKLLEPFEIKRYCTDDWGHTNDIYQQSVTR